MTFHCENCGTIINPHYNFCPFCGSQAPQKTVVLKSKEEYIKEGFFCLYCKVKNLRDALYCSSCGESLFKKPSNKHLYCPQCGEKNSIAAKHCFSCVLSLPDWFSMRGEIADRLGYQGNLVLLEKMTDMHYNFYMQKKVTMGRAKDNDIIIPCEWVSSRHCSFDLKSGKLVDQDSSNGTFINRSKERISSMLIPQIHEFNIADSFTFTVIQLKNLCVIRLTAVLDEKECKKVSNFTKITELRKYYYIFVLGDDEILIRKMDGKIVNETESTQDYYRIAIINKKYYYTEFSKMIEKQLILKKFNKLPVNWKIME